MKPISIHEYFWEPAANPPRELCVVFGKDAFLKMHAVRLVRDHVLEGEDAEFSLSRFEGPSVSMEAVLKEVATRPMFGSGRRMVVIEDADSFVTKNRLALEDYADKPSQNGVLLLQLESFASNTNLFKKVAQTGLIVEANALPEKELPKWIVRWAKHHYKAHCDQNAADLLLERIGPEHGLLDQELAKLSLMLEPKGRITVELVEKAGGSWRLRKPYEIIDAALAGKTAEALRQLDLLLLAGENAIGVLAQIAPRLRKLAAATQLILEGEKNGRKISVGDALKQVGGNPYFMESQLKMLGRHRGAKVLGWLLQADLDLKGGSRSDPRFVLEGLLIRISDPRLRGR